MINLMLHFYAKIQVINAKSLNYENCFYLRPKRIVDFIFLNIEVPTTHGTGTQCHFLTRLLIIICHYLLDGGADVRRIPTLNLHK